MPTVKKANEKNASKNRVELHFNDAENNKIEARVRKYNKAHKTEHTRKSYLQMLAIADSKK